MSQLVYFSSSSENTQRFIERLGLPAVRIPLNERERIQVDELAHALAACGAGCRRLIMSGRKPDQLRSPAITTGN